MNQTDWELVRRIPLFSNMDLAVAQRLIGSNDVRQYHKGVTLFQQGETASSFFIVLDGWVKVYRMLPNGQDAVVGVFRRGETFAEAAMFMGGHYPVCAETATNARLLKIDAATLRRAITESPEVAMSMLASVSHHVKFLVEQIEQIKLLSAPQRIADFLLQQCPCREGGCTVELPFEKALIANRLNMKPESFSRAIRKLQVLGVTVTHNQVEISDVRSLVEFVENGDSD
jgi:CRP-like cAMP-binding protein